MSKSAKKHPALWITAEWLRRRGACAGQVEWFRRLWPDGAELNLRNLRRAWRLGMSTYWLGLHVLRESTEFRNMCYEEPFGSADALWRCIQVGGLRHGLRGAKRKTVKLAHAVGGGGGREGR